MRLLLPLLISLSTLAANADVVNTDLAIAQKLGANSLGNILVCELVDQNQKVLATAASNPTIGGVDDQLKLNAGDLHGVVTMLCTDVVSCYLRLDIANEYKWIDYPNHAASKVSVVTNQNFGGTTYSSTGQPAETSRVELQNSQTPKGSTTFALRCRGSYYTDESGD